MCDKLVPDGHLEQPGILRCRRRTLRWYAGVLLLLTITSPTLVSRGSAAEEGITVDRIIEELRAKDIVRIQDTLNVTSIFDDRLRMKPFILDLWNVRRDKYPGLPWDIVTAPQVRIHLANILVPVAQRGGDGVRPQDIRDYAWSMTESPDGAVVREAFYAIGRFDLREDVARIEKYLADDRRDTYGGFFGAVWALAEMCVEDASLLLDAIENKTADPQRREIIADARRQWKAQKEQNRLCD